MNNSQNEESKKNTKSLAEELETEMKQLYDMVNDSYGRGPYEPDTLEGWREQLAELCAIMNWPAIDWHKLADGTVVDRQTGETILAPIIAPDYCTQNNGNCRAYSLSSYGMDCAGNALNRRQEAGDHE